MILENMQCKYRWQGIKLSDLSSEKSDSQTVNIQIVKSFSRPIDWVFKWWLIIVKFFQSMRSWEQYNIDKFYVYNLKKEVAIYKI